MIRLATIITLGVPGFYALTISSASAHAFGQRYDLPLPLWLYTTGAGAAVALSFVIMALFLRRTQADPEVLLSIDLLRVPGLRWLGHRSVITILEVISCSMFALILTACFFGNPNPFKNIAPIFVWVIWWVGLAFLSALTGNFWDLMNPWRILYQWVERLRGISPTARRSYPAWLGYWPAVILFFIFAWMELIFEGAEKPRVLGGLIIVYTIITWFGMARYGCENWLRHGEVFSVVFRLLARFAPLNGRQGKLRLRFPVAGLLVHESVPMSYVCLHLMAFWRHLTGRYF
jgi:hypothetical protein